ncbi:MAG: hypothetical protein ABIR15_12015 [Chitinophagaceae bacterium]
MKKIFFNFTALGLLFVCVAFFGRCHKEYSNEGGPKKYTSVYTLAGAGGKCTGSTLAGKYYMGKALSAANTIQIQADVTIAGSYSISTNTANGFRFSATGNFINTGLQNVLLTAVGTPAATGDFVFSAAPAPECTFSVTISKEPVIMASFAVDCQSAEVNGRLLTGNKLTSVDNISININVTAAGAYSITTDTLDGIYFSASGTFSSTGKKSVTLNGFGAPDLARNLVFSLKDLSSVCTVKVTVTDPDPLAVYVLESGFGNPNPCIYTVSGGYTVNTPLTSSNTVRINVYVTAKGNFTISTATVSGIIFSYSGEFTTTGAQQVTLTGSGTPDTKGVLPFIPEIVGPHPLGGQNCAFYVPVQ